MVVVFPQSAQNCFNQALDEDASVTDHTLDFKVTSTLLTCYLRCVGQVRSRIIVCARVSTCMHACVQGASFLTESSLNDMLEKYLSFLVIRWLFQNRLPLTYRRIPALSYLVLQFMLIKGFPYWPSHLFLNISLLTTSSLVSATSITQHELSALIYESNKLLTSCKQYFSFYLFTIFTVM